MIYIWFTGINYYKLAVEKDRDSIFTTIWKPGLRLYMSHALLYFFVWPFLFLTLGLISYVHVKQALYFWHAIGQRTIINAHIICTTFIATGVFSITYAPHSIVNQED